MMQNNDFDDVIKMVNENYEEKKLYRLYKEESKRMKEAKRLKKIKGMIVKSVAGVIVISSIISYIHVNSDINYEIIEEPNTTIVTQTDNQDILNNRETKFIEDINVIEEIEEQKLLKKYCNEVYNVNYDIAYNIASKLTDNFKSDEYLQTNNPGFKVNKKSANNKEHGMILFLRHLSQKPQDFGVTKNDIKNNDFVSNVKGNEESKVKHYSELFGIDPILTLAIEYHEAGRYSSDAYLNYNNPAGLMIDGNNLWRFESPDAGIIEHIYQLKKNYIDLGYNTPSEIQKRYAPENVSNDPTNSNQYWLKSVESIMQEIKNNQNIFENKNKTKI